MKKSYCIIPARGGSKRIPRKNIKPFLGQPIISYAIKAALNSELFEQVIVSTDDEEIAKIALDFGASVPFFRSSENANDFATTADVLLEVFEKLASQDASVISNVTSCCIYPTAPFVTKEILIKGFELMNTGDFDCVYPIQQFSFPTQRAVYFENHKVEWVNPSNALVRSQDLKPTYHDAGQFYFFRSEILLRTKKVISDNTSALVISELEAQDIDNEMDWKLAELKYKLLHESL